MTQAEALAGAVEYAVAAEHAGLSGAWIAEHHFISYGVCPSATLLAAHVAGCTRRIEVGTAACVLSARHPVALAEETALLDHLSGGRFRLGVGRGGPWLELEVLGTGLDRYEHGFAESLDLLLDSLRLPRVSAAGRFHAFRETALVPRPLTRPRPPVWVAATSPATAELAAERGLPLLLGMHEDDAGKARLLARYAEHAHRHGHDPAAAEHAAAAPIHVADTGAAARAALRRAMPAWLESGVGGYVRVDGSPGPRRDPRSYVEALLGFHPVGTPEQCAERLIETARATGVRRFLLMVEGAGAREHVLENIARVGDQVAPLVASAAATG